MIKLCIITLVLCDFRVIASNFNLRIQGFLITKTFINKFVDMAELADALDSGSSGETHAGSSPVIYTKQKQNEL